MPTTDLHERADPTRHYEPDDRWVPVDRRWFGLDRSTFPPAAIVLAFAIVMSVILPAINDSVSYDDEVVAGDVMELDGAITFAPAVGWDITSGVRATDTPVSGLYPARATVTGSGASFTVRTAPFTGDARTLLEQIKETSDALATEESPRVTGAPVHVTTHSGDRGVISRFSSSTADGVIAAFVFDGTGVEVVATGPAEVDHRIPEDIARMIVSIDDRTGEGS